MLKSQVSAGAHTSSLQSSMSQHMEHNASFRRNSYTSSIGSNNFRHLSNEVVNFITFNQDASCVAVGLATGYKIFNCKPSFKKCYQLKKDESIGIIEMLYCTSLIAVVGLGDEPGTSPRKLKIINTKRQATICDLIFPSTILQVKLTKSRMIVLLEDQIYIYDITSMNLLHTIETSPNSGGLCAISNDSCDEDFKSYLAYPSPPKTITHDSLLVAGINTNGGSNSVQNNVQSVSSSPNRVGDVILFDLETLQPMSVIEAHKSSLAALTLSNDGTLLATASDKGTIVRVFSVETGVKLYQFRRGTYPTKIYSLNFSSDNRYVVATSSSETVHIFRLGEEESLESKHRKKRSLKKKKKQQPETIAEENEEEEKKSGLKKSDSNEIDNPDDDDDDVIQDDGDDSDAQDEEDDDDDDDDDEESLEVVSSKSRKLSQGSTNSYASVSSNISNEENSSNPGSPLQPKSDPVVDLTRLSVARLIRRSSQTLGRKAAQKMGDFLPSRFSSILEPTRHFASLKINTIGKDVKSIAVINNEIQKDLVPQSYIYSKDATSHSQKDLNAYYANTNNGSSKDLLTLNLIHINVVTSDGIFYTYGLDPERGGDCILLHQYSLLDEGV